jgi:hypothetical protein
MTSSIQTVNQIFSGLPSKQSSDITTSSPKVSELGSKSQDHILTLNTAVPLVQAPTTWLRLWIIPTAYSSTRRLPLGSLLSSPGSSRDLIRSVSATRFSYHSLYGKAPLQSGELPASPLCPFHRHILFISAAVPLSCLCSSIKVPLQQTLTNKRDYIHGSSGLSKYAQSK